ncbi:serine/threonine protein kinase [Pendulispora brunnea]|uniref:Serine/threonine protein kinase n=1 Tax=Pendulispora brunnea TaxID=2905690 RepID=A0ABZ2K394_9BACT
MQQPLTLGRYTLFRELAAGGMATVYLGRVRGAVGFGRTVAIKRLHPHLARDPELVSRFVDEARLVARVHHPNVVPTLDVVAQDGEIFLVLEYVKGESLAGLLRASVLAGTTIPVGVALSVLAGALNGLHAAHEARDEKGEPLHIVHRDVSPQNVLVGADGIARVLDFGVAKAQGRLFGTTRDGHLKGKVPYMAPEQISGAATQQTDVYAAGVVLWETLACRGLFRHENELQLLQAIMTEQVAPPSRFNPSVPPEVDRITMKALARDPAQRYANAHAMAEDIDASGLVASSMRVAEWVRSIAGPALAARTELVAQVEGTEHSVTLKSPRGSSPPARPFSWRRLGAGALVVAAGVGALVAFRSAPERAPVVAASPTPTQAAPPPTVMPLETPPPELASDAAAPSRALSASKPRKPKPPEPPAPSKLDAVPDASPTQPRVPAGLATSRHE